MKKILFVSSVCLFLAGGGLKFAPVPVSAAMPFGVAQNDNSTQISPTASTQVELLNPGSEPRQELRFKPTVNAKQTMTITTNMDATSSISGQPAPKMKFPASVMKINMEVTQVDANGDIHSQFSFTDADVVADPTVPPQLLNTMQSAIKQVVGLKSSSIMDNRGQVKSGSIVLPEGGDPITKQLFEQMSNSLSQFSSPVPLEAVGKGAKWRVSSAVDIGGIQLTQNLIYELVDLKDNVSTLNVSVEQQAKSQELTLPGVPSGTTFTLKSLNSQGQGQMIMRLDGAMSIQGNMSIRSNNDMSVKVGSSGEETTVKTILSMQMTLESQRQK
jgi:hypothetical protein